jgi:hypothetical protein
MPTLYIAETEFYQFPQKKLAVENGELIKT